MTVDVPLVNFQRFQDWLDEHGESGFNFRDEHGDPWFCYVEGGYISFAESEERMGTDGGVKFMTGRAVFAGE